MKKIMALILAAILLLDLTSCHSYVYLTNQQDYKDHQDKEHVYALDLITINDSTIYFSSGFPGKLSSNEVSGPKQILLSNFKPDSIILNRELQAGYVLKDTIRYKVIYRNDSEWVCMTSDTIRIPFSEIKQIYIKKFDPGKSAAGIIGIVGVGIGLIIMLSYLMVSNM
jgi:hypothetical protein